MRPSVVCCLTRQDYIIANCCGNSRKTPMLLLALDTSTRQASIALCSEDELRGEYSWHVGNNHSVELLDRIQRIVVECNKTMQEIDVVAVATGPGSFNGVRVAVSAEIGRAHV